MPTVDSLSTTVTEFLSFMSLGDWTGVVWAASAVPATGGFVTSPLWSQAPSYDHQAAMSARAGIDSTGEARSGACPVARHILQDVVGAKWAEVCLSALLVCRPLTS